ncbi:hypothetical protein, partial [uncultured Corynebacterium sp.]|uniref:hypothetical protein n=1 Tax=uncultured Corynebacterium sp. TaxID=159447 RepID=UPI00280468AD
RESSALISPTTDSPSSCCISCTGGFVIPPPCPALTWDFNLECGFSQVFFIFLGCKKLPITAFALFTGVRWNIFWDKVTIG